MTFDITDSWKGDIGNVKEVQVHLYSGIEEDNIDRYDLDSVPVTDIMPTPEVVGDYKKYKITINKSKLPNMNLPATFTIKVYVKVVSDDILVNGDLIAEKPRTILVFFTKPLGTANIIATGNRKKRTPFSDPDNLNQKNTKKRSVDSTNISKRSNPECDTNPELFNFAEHNYNVVLPLELDIGSCLTVTTCPVNQIQTALHASLLFEEDQSKIGCRPSNYTSASLIYTDGMNLYTVIEKDIVLTQCSCH